MMDNTAASVIQPLVDSGEKLLWCGRPGQGIRLRGSDAFAIPFSILWCGFAVFWEYMATKQGAPFFFRLWGFPFVLVGLYMVAGRFPADALMRQHTFYGVTNDRIIIVKNFFSRQVKSLQVRTLSGMSLTERADGSGTIYFGSEAAFYQLYGPLPIGRRRNFSAFSPLAFGQGLIPAFEMLDRAKEVYDLINQAQKAAA